MKKELLTDDLGYKGYELRLLPIGGGGNIIVTKKGFIKEIGFRIDRISDGVDFDLPLWEDLKVVS